MISATSEYALRAALVLARQYGERSMRADEIADAIGAPRNYLAKILNAEELVSIPTAADQRKVTPVARPVVEQGEDAQALRADERLGSDDRHHPLSSELKRDHLGLDLGLAIGADAV